MGRCKSRSMREPYFQLVSHSESHQNGPTSTSEWYRIKSGFLRSSCSCILPNSLYNSVRDGWLLSLTMAWTISTSVHRYSLLQLQMVMNAQWFPNSFAHVRRPFPSIGGLRLARCETLFLTYSCVSPHLASVSRRWLKHRLVPLWHFPGCWNRSNLAEIFLRSQQAVRHQIHKSRLCHHRTFSGNIFLPSLWHGTLHSIWKKEMAAREHR